MHVFGYDVRVYHVFHTNKSSCASRTHLPAVFMAYKGKRVRSDTKAVVCNVYDYFEREQEEQEDPSRNHEAEEDGGCYRIK